ncbi:hypothetical protein [Bradyrhizobium sp. USDA 3650]
MLELLQRVTFQDRKTLDAQNRIFSITSHNDLEVASASKTLLLDFAEVGRSHAPGTYDFKIRKSGTKDFSTAGLTMSA